MKLYILALVFNIFFYNLAWVNPSPAIFQTKDFWREARILSNLHHPNVVAFYGVVPDGPGGTRATVTEYMVNGSLRHVLQKKDKWVSPCVFYFAATSLWYILIKEYSSCRTLDRRKKLIIAMDAAFGMEYLHLKDIVHFDLKCDNLLVNLRDSQRPICKVYDCRKPFLALKAVFFYIWKHGPHSRD